MFTNPDALWVDRFVTKLGSLGADGAADQFRSLALELYPDLNTVAPETVAEVEWEESFRVHH
ncbi:MAG: hypothetical protein JSR59_26620 [Proteobacteria bacterium]|nr:hypothetical protein [Pseudomonadota bacterium]